MIRSVRRLIVVTSRFPFGSQEAYLSAELQELAPHFDSIVVMPVRPARGAARHRVPPGVRVLSWPLLSLPLLARAVAAVCAHPGPALRTLVALLRSRDPGRVKNVAVIVKALALAHWAKRHRYDHVHAYWMSTPSTVAMLAAKAGGLGWSATAHRWDIYERNAFDVKERSVAFVRTISDRGQADLRQRMPSLNGRVLQLRLGTAVPAGASLPGTTSPASEFHVVCPAALVPVKGHTVLFAALGRLRGRNIPVRCTLYGVGPLKQSLEHAAAERGLHDVVHFAGFIPQAALHDAYRNGRFAAVVLSSRSAGETMMEGVPSALLEAMAFGVPVVATNSGSIGELLDDRCGLLVRAEDPDALAAALLDVYRNPAAARSRARRAYDLVLARHDARTQMRELAVAIQTKD